MRFHTLCISLQSEIQLFAALTLNKQGVNVEKRMKKIAIMLTAVVALLVGAITLTSCGGDEPDYPEIKNLYGRWQVKEMRADDSEAWRIWPYETTFLTFYANGSFRSEGYYGFGDGLWNADRSIITAALNDGTELRFRMLDATEGKALELRATTLFGSMDLRLSAVNTTE